MTAARLRNISLLAASILLLSGCLTVEESMKFDKDGTCVVTWRYVLPEAWIPTAEVCAKQLSRPGQTPVGLPEEQTTKAFFEAHPELELRQFRRQVKDGNLEIEIIALARHPLKAFEEGLFPGLTLHRDDLGDLTLTGNPLDSLPPLTSAETERFRAVLKGASLTFTLQTPTEIIASNGKRQAFNLIAWKWRLEPLPGELPLLNPPAEPLTAKW
jgi:hypothetical protein